MKSATLSLCVSSIVFAFTNLRAQDVHFNPFDAAPLNINPAYTGMFNGTVRVSGALQNEWGSNVPYNTYVLSADMPLFTYANGDYLAAGLQVDKDVAGDAGINNFSAMPSVAYHKLFGAGASGKSCDLAIGVQGGYGQKSLDLATLYFGNSVNYNNNGSVPYHLGLGNSINYFTINTGISFSQARGSKFNYTVGISANNLNQPSDAGEQQQNERLGIEKSYTGSLGANWMVSRSFIFRPALLFQSARNSNTFIAGNEFQYVLGKNGQKSFFKTVFVGGFYRNNNIAAITAGTEFRNFRVALGLDQAPVNEISGLSIQLQYIAARASSKNKRAVPCSRF